MTIAFEKRHLIVNEGGIERPLFNAKRKVTLGDIVHYYSAAKSLKPELWDDIETCIQLFLDLNVKPEYRKFGVYDGPKVSASASNLIGRNGENIELAPPEARTWHAGKSILMNMQDCNDFTKGYELIAAPYKALVKGRYDESLLKIYGYTDAQYETLAELIYQDMKYYGFNVLWVRGHDHVRRAYNIKAPIAKRRVKKYDPGPTFDWDRLRRMILEKFERAGNLNEHDLDGG